MSTETNNNTDVMDMDSITSMMNEVSSINKIEAAREIANTPTSAPANSYNRDNTNRPNIYMDTGIDAKPVDMNKLREVKAYTIIASEDNPNEETLAVVGKLVDILKAKKVVFRYDNTVIPSLTRDMFMKQDLTLPNTYQVFLPYYKKGKFDLEDVCTITTKWPLAIAAQHAKYYSKVTIKDRTDRTKILEEYFRFSRTSGGARSMMSNNMHMLLGKDCLQKLKFMILYSSCGCETMEDVKLKGYKEVNPRVQDTIKNCKEFGIPLFNIGKADGMKRLLELIQTIEA